MLPFRHGSPRDSTRRTRHATNQLSLLFSLIPIPLSSPLLSSYPRNPWQLKPLPPAQRRTIQVVTAVAQARRTINQHVFLAQKGVLVREKVLLGKPFSFSLFFLVFLSSCSALLLFFLLSFFFFSLLSVFAAFVFSCIVSYCRLFDEKWEARRT